MKGKPQEEICTVIQAKEVQQEPYDDHTKVELVEPPSSASVGERITSPGLVKYIPLDEMHNRKVCVLCNLKPASMRGIKSQAMVLAANKDDPTSSLLFAGDDEERYRGCESLVLSCPSCSTTFDCPPMFKTMCILGNEKPDSLGADESDYNFWHKLGCPKCFENGVGRISPAMIANQVKRQAEKFVLMYYRGLLTCDDETYEGFPRVSLDALVGVFTRLGRDVEKIGIADSYPLAERAASVTEEAKPLLTKMKVVAEDLQPLLADVRDSGLLKEVENLTRSLTQASDDLRRAYSSIMTPEDTELIQKSIYTLIFTLKNSENVSSDILGFTGDEATRKNLKLLIKSLSRLL
ncbi:unnamed protein product [Lathyrus sativus]|nr:unnamed protein product [Lathyrus sativus]